MFGKTLKKIIELDDGLLRLLIAFACVLFGLGLLTQFSLYSEINVWRQDSMYYVGGYGDKLVSEGRWINYLAFDFLRHIPAFICILISYACIGFYLYVIARKSNLDPLAALFFSFLSLNVPVLCLQMEWPETLLIGYIFLPLAALSVEKVKIEVFFLVFSVLFFSTFSAFYFLLPLLFIHRILDFKSFFKIMVIWVAAFVLGYIITELIVKFASGSYIQIAAWRDPHPVHSVRDLLSNSQRIATYAIDHFRKFTSLMGRGYLTVIGLMLLFTVIKNRAYYKVLLGLACVFSVYITVVPAGVFVQERTTLISWIAFFGLGVLLIHKEKPYLIALNHLFLLIIGLKLSVISTETILSFRNVTGALQEQIKLALPAELSKSEKIFIVANGESISSAFTIMLSTIEYRPHYSEGFHFPLEWAPSFKVLGFNNIYVCAEEEKGACEIAAKASRESTSQGIGLFKTTKIAEGLVFSPRGY